MGLVGTWEPRGERHRDQNQGYNFPSVGRDLRCPVNCSSDRLWPVGRGTDTMSLSPTLTTVKVQVVLPSISIKASSPL